MKKRNAKAEAAPTSQELLADDLKAIRRQLRSGKPLQYHQRRQLEAAMAGSSESFAPNFNGLANALGVSRQLIAWHRFKPDAPQAREDGRHDIAAWREYLARVGRIHDGSAAQSKNNLSVEVENAMALLYQRISDAAPRFVQAALEKCGIAATPQQRDTVTLYVWLGIAEVADAEMKSRRMDGVLDGDEDGEAEYPPEIQKLCSRMIESQPA